jgi:hypothetical protein
MFTFTSLQNNIPHVSFYEKKRQQKYNVIFMWDKKPNLNRNLTLNLFLFCIEFK